MNSGATRTALVTGARGFIGSAVVAQLQAAGLNVVAASRELPEPGAGSAGAGTGRSGGASGSGDVTWRQADVRSQESVNALLESVRPDLVFHLAADVSGDRSIERVLPMIETDLLGSVHVLLAATKAGVERIVFTGSLLQEPLQAMAEPVPPSPYGAAKWAAAGYARMFHALYETPVVIVRPSMVYGPGQLDLEKVVPYVTTSLLRGEAPRLTSGRWRVDWLYVDDAAAGIVAAATAPGIAGGTIDLGSGETASIRDIAAMIGDAVAGQAEPIFGDLVDRPLEPSKEVDVEAVSQRLGWRAGIPLAEGIRRTVDWYRDREVAAAGIARTS
jgi:nucleoside-diphosphate-sugar epimerase